ncbi:MAG: RNA methyltransferase, partial [Clostridia bacterium]|nr:RNA methyltransferase [Clostridia bacterium]
VIKNRFEPSHSLALALKPHEVKRTLELSEEDALKYIGGQTLSSDGEKGWTLAVYQGISIGWCKCDGNYAKNHYPKGLRK